MSLPAPAADSEGDDENERVDVKRAGTKTRSTGALKRKRLSLPALPVAPAVASLTSSASVEESTALPSRKRRRSSGLPAPASPTPLTLQGTTNTKPNEKGTKASQSRKRARAGVDKPEQMKEQEGAENIDTVKVVRKEKDKEMKKGALFVPYFPFLSLPFAFRFPSPFHQIFSSSLPVFYSTSLQSEQHDLKRRKPNLFLTFSLLFLRLILAFVLCFSYLDIGCCAFFLSLQQKRNEQACLSDFHLHFLTFCIHVSVSINFGSQFGCDIRFHPNFFQSFFAFRFLRMHPAKLFYSFSILFSFPAYKKRSFSFIFGCTKADLVSLIAPPKRSSMTLKPEKSSAPSHDSQSCQSHFACHDSDALVIPIAFEAR